MDGAKPSDRARARLERCYREFGFRVHGRARRILGSDEDARDVTQAVFLRLADHLDGLRNADGIASWIYVVTTREALQLLRSRQRRRRREQQWAEEQPKATAPGGPRVEAAEQIRRLLQSVPDEQLEAALLYFVDQLGQDEIARLLGVSRRTVIRRINAFRAAAEALDGGPRAEGGRS